MSVELLLGNEAIGLGLVEQGCQVMTAYPGTPSSEILVGVEKYKKRLGRQIYTEWSTNEKVAFEVALAASWSGLRSAVAMKQVGLNVASDPLFSSAYTGVQGGFIIISADDPGPMSSQTEQDTRLIALNAKVPVFDPSTPEEARRMVSCALELSEKYKIPVILRPTTRLCHALQSLSLDDMAPNVPSNAKKRFIKDTSHWTATPNARYLLHKELNQKIAAIEKEFNVSPLNYIEGNAASDMVGIIASGIAFNTVNQVLNELNVQIPVLKIGTPFPLPLKLVGEFISSYKTVVVIEEPDACIELQIPDRRKVRGKLDGTIPAEGELTPDILFVALAGLLAEAGYNINPYPGDLVFEKLVTSLSLPVHQPRLCPGCAHRSAFFSLKRTFGPNAIYPSDIGCYTLGMNLRAVDTFIDMGAAVTMANGFYQANAIIGDKRPIIATIGDSTFLHSGIPPLINAVHTGARFVLIILDNHTTAMTGFQPTAANEYLADGSEAAKSISIEKIVQACGVGFVRVTDPYEQNTFQQVLKEAYSHTQAPGGGVAVVIADRPCILYDSTLIKESPIPVFITAECDGCRYCLEVFECPAMVLSADRSRVDIDRKICIDCGQCIDACYKGFIVLQ